MASGTGLGLMDSGPAMMGERLLGYVDLDKHTNYFCGVQHRKQLVTTHEVGDLSDFVFHLSACTSFCRSGIGVVFAEGTGVEAGSSADLTNWGCCSSLIATANAGFSHKSSIQLPNKATVVPAEPQDEVMSQLDPNNGSSFSAASDIR